ncbi:tRNA pseudouridine(38/39) synthase [Anaeramoeba flamelloides]|uniref:tRNA pseudouridine(38/39) synthase n=1 Tax=Anaeramoeba flamelloides TaxID=1746091 RepID=A0ABQ8XNY9_9EUKA|nr:tRNA pseudouridine(38/39) synthase [Anaeramoeba flamelloides]
MSLKETKPNQRKRKKDYQTKKEEIEELNNKEQKQNKKENDKENEKEKENKKEKEKENKKENKKEKEKEKEKTNEKQENKTTKQKKKRKRKNQKQQKKQKQFKWNLYNRRRIVLQVTYDGEGYSGFASQTYPHSETIQEHVFNALKTTKLIKDEESANLQCSGRTDKGVSALGQIISLTVRTNLAEGVGVIQSDCDKKLLRTKDREIDYTYILNQLLPNNVILVAWAPVPVEFNARNDCISRTYKYFFEPDLFNLDKMKMAASKLAGEHDFRNFCKISPEKTSLVRRILSASIDKIYSLNSNDESLIRSKEIWAFTVKGKGFLWHQVRAMMAILFLIGEGKEEPELIDTLLDTKKVPSRPCYMIAPEWPLLFYFCEYEQKINWQYSLKNQMNIYDVFQNRIQNSTWKSILGMTACAAIKEQSFPSKEVQKFCLNTLDGREKYKFGESNHFLVRGNINKKKLGYTPVLELTKCKNSRNLEHFPNKIENLKKTYTLFGTLLHLVSLFGASPEFTGGEKNPIKGLFIINKNSTIPD